MQTDPVAPQRDDAPRTACFARTPRLVGLALLLAMAGCGGGDAPSEVSAPLVAPGKAIKAIAPSSPVGVRATKGVYGGSLIVAFSPPADGGDSPVSSYMATCTASGAPDRTATGSSSPLLVVALAGGGLGYTCSVVAINAAGPSAPAAGLPVVPHAPGKDLSTDLDADGRPDYLIANQGVTTSGRYLYYGLQSNNQWEIAAAADFNLDGTPDLLLQHRVTGDRYLWYVTMSEAFGSFHPTITGDRYLGDVDPAWRIAGVGDFNRDGKPDIVWQNVRTGSRYLWLMDGSSYTSAVNLGTYALDWRIAAVADYDGDGDADILWENEETGVRWIWYMDGQTYSSGSALAVMPSYWTIVAAIDINDDSKRDLVWFNKGNLQRWAWYMDGLSSIGGMILP